MARSKKSKILQQKLCFCTPHSASFRLTKQSFNALRDENIPKDILEKLRPLEDKEIISEEEFLNAVKMQIGQEEIIRHKELILKHTEILKNAGIPDEILQNLKPLENQYFAKENEVLIAIEKKIGREQAVKYKALILKHAADRQFNYFLNYK